MQLKGLNQFILYTLLGTVLLTDSGLLSRSLFIMQTMNKRPCARVWPKYAIICLICHLSSQQTELNQGNARQIFYNVQSNGTQKGKRVQASHNFLCLLLIGGENGARFSGQSKTKLKQRYLLSTPKPSNWSLICSYSQSWVNLISHKKEIPLVFREVRKCTMGKPASCFENDTFSVQCFSSLRIIIIIIIIIKQI